MLSPHYISKGAAVALAVGAFVAPAALAAPIGGYSPQDKQVIPSSAQSQLGIPAILPALNASQSAAIQRAEQQAAHGVANTLSNARFSTAATNAYPSRSRRVTAGNPSVRIPDTPYGNRALGSNSYSRLAGVPTSQISPRPILPAWASSEAAAFRAVSSPGSPTVARPAGASDGFAWGDAGIGAAGCLAIVAIGGGLVLVKRRPRRTETTAVATG